MLQYCHCPLYYQYTCIAPSSIGSEMETNICKSMYIIHKLLLGGNFCQFCDLLYLEKCFFVNIFSCVNDYIEDAATLTTLAKINCTKYLCNIKVSGLTCTFSNAVHSEVPPYDLTKIKISATSYSFYKHIDEFNLHS